MGNVIHNLASGNRIGFLLLSIFLLNVSYPLTEISTTAALLYVGVYLALTGSAVYLVSSDRRLLIFAVLLGGVIAVAGGITISSGFTTPRIQLLWNVSLLMQLIMIITLMVIFIIQAERVTREVLFAAIVIYFLMAGIFSISYTVIETLTPDGAFVSSSGAEITWQRLNYFSLVTISTLGYGDIVPVSGAAQSLSALEASLGTLYIAILIGRFVSLYQHEGALEATKTQSRS